MILSIDGCVCRMPKNGGLESGAKCERQLLPFDIHLQAGEGLVSLQSLLLLVVRFEIASAPMPAQNPDKYSLQAINMDATATPDFKSESSQQLMTAELAGDDSQGSSTPPFPGDNLLLRHSVRNTVSKAEWITVIILCYVNLINYMDRFTTAGE